MGRCEADADLRLVTADDSLNLLYSKAEYSSSSSSEAWWVFPKGVGLCGGGGGGGGLNEGGGCLDLL